jgi:hypothetical protein
MNESCIGGSTSLGFGSTQSLRPRQPESIGHAVEILAHLQLRIVGDVVGAVRPSMLQRGAAGGRQIVGMDVVGEDIVCRLQSRGALLQPFHRQAITGIDPGRTQDADGDTGAAPESAQLTFGIQTTDAARRVGSRCTRFVDHRTLAVAIDTAGTNVDEALW